MRKPQMGSLKKLKDAWAKIKPNQDVTPASLQTLTQVESSSTVRSFLSGLVKKGLATRISYKTYRKVLNKSPASFYPVSDFGVTELPTRSKPKEIPGYAPAELGDAVINLFMDMKKVVVQLRACLREEKETSRLLIEENKKLKEMYKQAQEKIIKLNSAKRSGRPGLNLHELQEQVMGAQTDIEARRGGL